jgi:rod shape-determining protein MreC
MSKLNRWVVLFAVILLTAVVALAGWLKPLVRGIQWAMDGTVRAVSGEAQTVGSRFQATPSEQAAKDRIRELEAQLAANAVDYVRLQALKEENQSLRATAKFLDSTGYDTVGAHVISREMQDGRALLLIDRGSNDHLEVGQAVVTGEGVFVGKVSQIHERVSTVELITDPHSRVAAALAEDRSLTGVVEGRANGAAVLTYIPSSKSLGRDQIIMTAGTEEKVPAHLPLAIVNAVEGKPTDPFFSAILEPLVSLDHIALVSVLRPTALEPSL